MDIENKYLRLNIEIKYSRLDIENKHSRLDIEIKYSRLDIKIEYPRLDIEIEYPRLNILHIYRFQPLDNTPKPRLRTGAKCQVKKEKWVIHVIAVF